MQRLVDVSDDVDQEANSKGFHEISVTTRAGCFESIIELTSGPVRVNGVFNGGAVEVWGQDWNVLKVPLVVLNHACIFNLVGPASRLHE